MNALKRRHNLAPSEVKEYANLNRNVSCGELLSEHTKHPHNLTSALQPHSHSHSYSFISDPMLEYRATKMKNVSPLTDCTVHTHTFKHTQACCSYQISISHFIVFSLDWSSSLIHHCSSATPQGIQTETRLTERQTGTKTKPLDKV